jgi:hypothetical protein
LTYGLNSKKVIDICYSLYSTEKKPRCTEKNALFSKFFYKQYPCQTVAHFGGKSYFALKIVSLMVARLNFGGLISDLSLNLVSTNRAKGIKIEKINNHVYFGFGTNLAC